MKKYILIILSIFSLNILAQDQKKDTLYFKFDTNYIKVMKDFDDDYIFMFKKEKLVTSAFGKIVKEDLIDFDFVQSETSIAVYKLNPKKIYKLKTYLNKRENIFKDKRTKKMDAYKLMRYFDNHTVFFLLEKKLIKVKVRTSLYE